MHLFRCQGQDDIQVGRRRRLSFDNCERQGRATIQNICLLPGTPSRMDPEYGILLGHSLCHLNWAYRLFITSRQFEFHGNKPGLDNLLKQRQA